MTNCSIPNSSPATGRISMRSLRRSRKQNSQSIACASVNRGWWLGVRKRRQATALQSALRARKIRRWRLNVERWEFSANRRVKGAWWPSRSSKPSSPRKWRGRFDSYPLRLFICDCRFPNCRSLQCTSDDFSRKSQFENRKLAEGR